jgi:restriction system protein
MAKRKQSYKAPPIVTWAYKTYKRNAREAARDRRQMEVAAEKEAKAHAREERKSAREEAALHQQRSRQDAELETQRLEEFVRTLRNLHVPFVAQAGPLDLDILLRELQPTEFQSTLKPPKDQPVPPVEAYLQAVRPPSFFERLVSSSRHEDELQQARHQHQADVAARGRRLKEYAEALDAARQQHAQEQAEKERARSHIEGVKNGLLEGDPDSLARYCELTLGAVAFPDDIEVDFACNYSDGTMSVEIAVPDRCIVPEIASVRYIAKRDETESTARKESDIRSIYQSAIAGLLVGAVHCTFASDADEAVTTVAAKAVVPGRDPRTGQAEWAEVASVVVPRGRWASVDAMHVEPMACLQALSAKFGVGWKSL